MRTFPAKRKPENHHHINVPVAVNGRIGKFLWPNPAVFASTREGWKADASDMLPGLNEIGGLHVYVDYRGRKLYLSRRPTVA